MDAWCIAIRNRTTNQVAVLSDPEQLVLRPELQAQILPFTYIDWTQVVLGPEIESHLLPFVYIDDEPYFGAHEFTGRCYCNPRIMRNHADDICWVHKEMKLS